MHQWQAKVLFTAAFVLGWFVWPNAYGWLDFIALCAVAVSTAGLSITLTR